MTESHMSEYEKQAWIDLTEYWRKKSERRELPPAASKAIETTRSKVSGAARTSGDAIRRVTPDAVRQSGMFVIDQALEPAIHAAVNLIELVTETVQELSDPERVLTHHRDNGLDVRRIQDLRAHDLEVLDPVVRRLAWKSRLTGAFEGSAMGALTFVPVAGSVAAIGADLVVMHALTTAVSTRAAHAYGIDPTTEAERHHLDAMLRKAWAGQAAKSGTVKSAHETFRAGAGRVRWSEKFRNDHRIARALESLMKQMGNGQHVPIDKVVTKMPAIAVVTAAGVNSAVLGTAAKNAVRYSQTIHLAAKHGLELPANLS